MIIKHITYETLLEVWLIELWKDRVDIESRSAMTVDGGYDMANMNCPLICYALINEENIVGVNSVHICGDNTMRSRGLWVHPTFRGRGLGKILLRYAEHLTAEHKCDLLWSFPRKTSWPAYFNSGFERISEWTKSDTSPENAFAVLREPKLISKYKSIEYSGQLRSFDFNFSGE